MLATTEGQQSFFIGFRSVFFNVGKISAQGGLVYLAGRLARRTGNPALGWSAAFALGAPEFSWSWAHTIVSSCRARPVDEPKMAGAPGNFRTGFFKTFAVLFSKTKNCRAAAFPVALPAGRGATGENHSNFPARAAGNRRTGAGLEKIGIIYGTIGIIAFVAGALLGGFVVARQGLKFWLWPMLLAIHLPDAVFIWLAYARPDNSGVIGAGVAMEQFGYGFGFTAFMLYMIYIARGEHQTAHYAICTGFMALGMMLPGHGERLAPGTPRLPAFLRVGAAGDDSEFSRRPADSPRRGVWPPPGRLNRAPKRIALNGPAFPKSKFTMKSIHCNRPGRLFAAGWLTALVLAWASAARADLASLFTNGAPATVVPRRPCIILVVADGLGYGDLSCYGQTKFQTPNLDRLAAEGVRFTSYYAGNAASSPARAALLLGRDSGHLPARADVNVPLAADEVTVAQALKSCGYHTGLIGEWNLGNDSTTGAPWRKGFDEFAGYFDPADAGNFYADYLWRYMPRTRPAPTNNPVQDFAGREALYPNLDGKKGQYIPDLLTLAALNFCKSSQPDRFNRHQPFFLLLNYKIPGAGTGAVPTDAPYSEEPWPQPAKNRAAMISRLDGFIGQLLEQLKKPGLSNNTILFFTSDTGPQRQDGVDPKLFQSAGPFRGGRGELYEGGLRVPMLAWCPGKIPAGRISDFAWAAWDFLPTAMDLVLAPAPPNLDGISVWPVLLGQTQTNRHECFHWELKNGRNVCQTIDLGDWQAVQNQAAAPLELYNLKTDPGETRNVADQHPDVVAKIRGLMQNSR